MILNIVSWSILSINLVSTAIISPEDYWTARANFIHEEEVKAIGGNLIFEEGERTANDILMAQKKKELDEVLADSSKFLPARNFMEIIEEIEKSKVFEIMKKLPKGAVLHTHDTAFASDDSVFNLTYHENLYICEDNDDLSVHYFQVPSDDCDWKLLSELRKNLTIADSLNERIRRKMTLLVSHPDEAYPDTRAAWKKFHNILKFIIPLLSYRPAYENHLYHGLQELYNDNILYLEMRTILPTLYELNGTEYEPLAVMGIYKSVVERFKRDHPDFIGLNVIYSPMKYIPQDKFQDFINRTIEIKRKYPNFFAGFDLVGEEDALTPLRVYADGLNSMKNEVNMFFHAGETNWYGSTDENLIDAILLNTKRIGHGYAAIKHPSVLDYVKKHKIALEICPISNQVLGLVKDLRNHPASVLFADGYPVVVSNDDCGFWGARGLSYDFYEAFMGIMSRNSDIRALKQLAMNSIIFSSLSEDDKKKALDIWRRKWTEFLNYLNNHDFLTNEKF